MAKLTREFLITRVFSDPTNYPYGFSRSGDFTISESKALSHYGCLITALVNGQIEPSNAADERLLDVAFGCKSPEGLGEKAWVKYQKRINRPKPANIYGSGPVLAISSDDEYSPDIGGVAAIEIDLGDL
jgi:uncharacterized protein YifE (UPF0438 family)